MPYQRKQTYVIARFPTISCWIPRLSKWIAMRCEWLLWFLCTQPTTCRWVIGVELRAWLSFTPEEFLLFDLKRGRSSAGRPRALTSSMQGIKGPSLWGCGQCPRFQVTAVLSGSLWLWGCLWGQQKVLPIEVGAFLPCLQVCSCSPPAFEPQMDFWHVSDEMVTGVWLTC